MEWLPHDGSAKWDTPPLIALVCSGRQAGAARFVQASTTTVWLLAQEMVNPKPVPLTPKSGAVFRITGYANTHGAVGTQAQELVQPLVPGK